MVDIGHVWYEVKQNISHIIMGIKEQLKKSLFFVKKFTQKIFLKFPQISNKQKFPKISVKK